MDTAEPMTPSQVPGSSMSQDSRTLEDRAAVPDKLNQNDRKQQPLWYLAAVIPSLQFEVQLILEVLQTESRLTKSSTDRKYNVPHGTPLASTEHPSSTALGIDPQMLVPNFFKTSMYG